MQSPRRVYFNNIGSICTDSLRHGNGLSALLLLTRAAKKVARLKAARLKHAPWKAGLSATRRLALNNRGLLNTACQPHTPCTLNWVRQRGREGATKDGGWEGGKKGRMGDGGGME